MRITQYSDYALRTLIYLAVKPDKYSLANIQDIADSYGISKNHLTKIVHQLSRLGLIESMRGKNGGIRLAKNPKDINIGTVLRQTEADFAVVDCFNPLKSTVQPKNQANDEQFSPQKAYFLQNNITDYVPINEKLVVKQVDDLPEPSCCVISPVCQLKPIFFEAIQAFIQVFDRYTLADMIQNQDGINALLK
ncbi:RrF2 family transcriptional regulator [Faucicola mancuniensis]|uniref:RrF2 family transcriptional regulator n=1 Tax=Faucicola mancuniensis TaxID=1309795 RepID=UPI0028ECBFBB|nr:Rrf2 family transcriptional regulator [uncultured Moraxella sp.]